jgi:serine/threonine-protein kinase HipA
MDFFENLLPEGPTLDAMARLAGVPRSDTFGILSQFGRDCAGAVTILLEGNEPAAASEATYVPVSDEELADALRNLTRFPLGADPSSGYRPSLAGFQQKLLLHRDVDGSWLRPVGDSPSTWIVKPDGAVAMASNEIACLRLAAMVGLRVPDCELVAIDGVPALAIRRYDRTPDLARIHQEDGAQATGTPAGWRYEQQGGPSLKSFARVLRDFGTIDELPDLLRQVTFNVAIGNADAHVKNFSVLHPADASGITLAPVYDVLSTLALRPIDHRGERIEPDRTMGQRVGGALRVDEVTRQHLGAEAHAWGLRSRTAAVVIDEMLGRIADTEIPDSWLSELVTSNLTRIG